MGTPAAGLVLARAVGQDLVTLTKGPIILVGLLAQTQQRFKATLEDLMPTGNSLARAIDRHCSDADVEVADPQPLFCM